MHRYEIITLVDITRSNPLPNETNQYVLRQQANFNSLVQAINLRANVAWTSDPKKYDGQMPYDINGRCVYWQWFFDIEQVDVFQKNNNPVGLLIDDLHNVPIINNLDNSVDIHPAAFQTSGINQNVWIYLDS